MATLEELEQKRKQLEALIKDKKRSIAKNERKARNHALMVIGGLVLQHTKDKDWKCVDWNALAKWLATYNYKIAECEAEALPTKEALKRLREWEKTKTKVQKI